MNDTDAMGWDAGELTRLLLLLHQEPHVRGLGYGQYKDQPRPRCSRLATQTARDYGDDHQPFSRTLPKVGKNQCKIANENRGKKCLLAQS